MRPVGGCGAVAALVVADDFTSIATSSQRSPLPLAAQLQVTGPADALIVELDAPVIAPAILISHSCVQVGVPSVIPP